MCVKLAEGGETLSPNRDQIEGKVRELEGRLQSTVAGLKGESAAEGQVKQTEGKAQQVVGNVKEALHKAID